MSKFPNITQLDSMDCGPSCLKILASYYGKNIPLKMLKDECNVDREGVSMLALIQASSKFGLDAKGVKLTWNQLLEIEKPCIVHWNDHHFVVVYKIKENRSGNHYVYVSDPAGGLLKYDEKTFTSSWLGTEPNRKLHGYALLVTTTPLFYENEYANSEHLNYKSLYGYIKPYKSYFFKLFLGILTGSLISLILPFLTSSMVDNGIKNSSVRIIVAILIAQLMLMAGKTVNDIIKNWLMLHLSNRISISLISNFINKLLHLPLSYFDHKKVGDIMQRIEDHSRIQMFLTSTLLSISIAFVTFVIYSFVMANYNLLLLGVFFIGSILYVIWILLFLRKRKKLDYMRFQEMANNQNGLVQMIYGIQDIKLSNSENNKKWQWEKVQLKLFDIGVKGMSLAQTQEVGGAFINQSKNFLMSFLAAYAVVESQMTLGMMMATQYIIGQMNAPLSQFVSFIQTSQDAKLSMERINEIHNTEEEDYGQLKNIPPDKNIIFNNVSFRYNGPNSPFILKNLNFSIHNKKTTAIVGSSGSGKTTILKLILGFYHPTVGSISINDIPLEKYSQKEWRDCCGAVMQEGYIFSDTILNNIALSDEEPDMVKVNRSIKIANLYSYVESLPLGLDTKLGADGQGLSTGQKQRLLIARAIYKKAEYLIFDEATNALDSNNEKEIMKNLQDLFHGKTAIIVAHRLSTVKNADNILVLEDGEIVEQGTHEDLIKLHSYYYRLVKNQLN